VTSSQSVADLAAAVAKNFFGNKSGGAPSPVAYMKQLPASQWEHMGLIIGGSGTNYAKDTAKNTAKMVQLLEKVYAFDKNPVTQAVSSIFGIPSLP